MVGRYGHEQQGWLQSKNSVKTLSISLASDSRLLRDAVSAEGGAAPIRTGKDNGLQEPASISGTSPENGTINHRLPVAP